MTIPVAEYFSKPKSPPRPKTQDSVPTKPMSATCLQGYNLSPQRTFSSLTYQRQKFKAGLFFHKHELHFVTASNYYFLSILVTRHQQLLYLMAHRNLKALAYNATKQILLERVFLIVINFNIICNKIMFIFYMSNLALLVLLHQYRAPTLEKIIHIRIQQVVIRHLLKTLTENANI